MTLMPVSNGGDKMRVARNGKVPCRSWAPGAVGWARRIAQKAQALFETLEPFAHRAEDQLPV